MEQEPVNQDINKPKRNEKGQILKGSTGNSKGRPKKDLCMTDLLRDALTKKNSEEAKAIIEVMIKNAKGGNYKFVDLLIRYIDGLPKQKIELSGDEQNPLNIIFKVDKPDAD